MHPVSRYVRVMQPSDQDRRAEADKSDVMPSQSEIADQPAPSGRRPVDWKLAFASLPIALGIFLIGWALVSSVTGDEVTKLPDAIEEINPPPDAVQVLAQTGVVADLAEGFFGRMEIDGVAFDTMLMQDLTNNNVEPGEQVDIPDGVVFEPGNDTLTFTPGPSIDLDRFGEGLHTVDVIYWKLELGEGTARTYTWTFNVV